MLKKISRKDIILLFIIIGKIVRVSRNNEVIDEFDLNETLNKNYIFEDEENNLVIRDGKADIISANCKNQICVNTDPINEVGETIACLPHGLIIEIIEE